MKSFYYFLVGISLLAFGYTGIANINTKSDFVFYSTPKQPEKPQPKKQKIEKSTPSKVRRLSLLTGEITTTDALLLAPTITAVKSVAVQGGGNAIPGSQLNYTIVVII